MKKANVAILGATGCVGREMLKVLAERDFPIGELRLLASARSAGKKIEFRGREYAVEEAGERSFRGGRFGAGGGERGAGGAIRAGDRAGGRAVCG